MQLTNIGGVLINIKNICSIERNYTGYNISKREEYIKYYLLIGFIGGTYKEVIFNSKDELEKSFTYISYM